MNKSILIGVAAICIVGGIFLFSMRPEPTPQDRLIDAAEQAGEAVRDATEAAGDAAQEASEAVREELERSAQEIEASLTETAANMMESVNEASQATSDALAALIADWRASGIVTSEGIDFDAAVAAVEASDMDLATKARFIDLLEDLRDAPDRAMARLQELEAAVSQ